MESNTVRRLVRRMRLTEGGKGDTDQHYGSFDQWAILEIMGHQTYAGRVSEQTIGGTSLVRIDVPETDAGPAYTKLFGAAAIYCISPVTEQVARQRARQTGAVPMTVYDFPRDIILKLSQLEDKTEDDDDELEDEDPESGF